MRKNKMMNSELNNHQTDWIAQAEELNDTEASQVNGGANTTNPYQENNEATTAMMDAVQAQANIQT
jgi:hypothetical protein